MKYYGLIIPRSYNDYFSRSDPAAIQEQMRAICDDELNTASTNPIQNKPVADAIGAINDMIPAQASDANQLADKAFVNSSVGTNTANYISDNGDPFQSVAALEAYAGTVTNNDYAFVTGTDSAGNTYYDRYKATVNGSSVTWAKEYRLNNSSFTAAEWAAIQSGITAAAVARIPAVAAAEIDDTTAAQNKCWSAAKNSTNNVVVNTDAQADAKTIPTYYAVDGASCKVLFKNGHSGASFTINNKNVYAIKDGAPVLMGSHTISSVAWYLQAYTTLELLYDATLDSNNGGWLIIGNPVVLSSTGTTQNYTIYANGSVKDIGYSTEEQWTGRYWKDGKKIYSKIWTLPQISGASQGNVDTNVNYIDTIIKTELVTSSNTRFNYSLSARINGTTLQAYAYNGAYAGDSMLLEYTKTV